MKRKRVLQVTGGLGIGGIEKITTSFLKEIDKSKYEMDFLVYGNTIGEYETNVSNYGGRIIRVPSPYNGYYNFYKNVKDAMKKNGPYDIVHTHVLFNSGFIVRAAAKNRIPIIIAHSHDNLQGMREGVIRKIYYFIMRKWINRYATKICACSELAGEYLFGKEKFKKYGIVLHNKIDISRFNFDSESRKNIRECYGIGDDDTVIGNIGRIEEQKNQEYLLIILKRLLNFSKKFKLLIVGDGSLKNNLCEQINQLKLNNNVIMAGKKENINELLSAMDIFALTSVHEGLGIVLIEAQANGLCCLAPQNVVPMEAKILDSFVFMKGTDDNNIDEWVRELRKKRDRAKSPNKLVEQAGYDIRTLGEELDKLYSNL